MTEVEEEPTGPARLMDDEELALAQMIYGSIHRATHDTPRAQQQSEDFLIGISDLGTCAERTRRTMLGIQPEETDKLEAFVGSWLGAGVEAAVQQQHPDVRTQVEVSVALDGDQNHYEVQGHADLVHDWGVGDVKTTDGLEIAKRNGPSRQQLFQRHLLCLALWQAGQLSVPLDEAKTYNVWLDRAGRTKEVYVHMDHFSWDVVREATLWLDEVVYAYRQGVEAAKEPPRTWCEKVCGHFQDCRMFDSDVEGLLLDMDVAAAVSMKREALALEKRAKLLKTEANGVLVGVNGYVRTEEGNFQVRNTWVNPSDFSVSRSGHYRINVTPVKGK